MGSSKGQVNSMDALLSVMVFSVLLVFLFSSWFGGIASAQNALSRNRMEYAALSASDLLMKSQGLPANWESNASSVQTIGLASSQNVLSASKLANFTALQYNVSKALLGTTSEFYFVVEGLNGGTLYSTGNSSLVGNAKVSVARFGMLGSTKVRMRLVFYG